MFKIIKKSKLELMEQEIKTLYFINNKHNETIVEFKKQIVEITEHTKCLEKQNNLLKYKSKEDTLVYDVRDSFLGFDSIVLYRVIKGEFVLLQTIDYTIEDLKLVKENGFISRTEYILKNVVGD